MGYHEICLNIKDKGWTKVKGDECIVGPHAYMGDQWVGFDDLETVKIKVIPLFFNNQNSDRSDANNYLSVLNSLIFADAVHQRHGASRWNGLGYFNG